MWAYPRLLLGLNSHSHTRMHTHIHITNSTTSASEPRLTHPHTYTTHNLTRLPSLAPSPSLFLSVSCSLLPTLIHKMAASQLQLLARNLRMRGQGQQRARRDLFVLFPPAPFHLFMRTSLSNCFHPAPTLRFVRLILLLTFASLPHPCPLPPRPSPPLQNKPDTLMAWEGN